MRSQFQKQLEKKLRKETRLLYYKNKKPVPWRNLSLATGILATILLVTFFLIKGTDTDFLHENINDLDLDNTEITAITNIMQNYNISDFDTLNSSINALVHN